MPVRGGEWLLHAALSPKLQAPSPALTCIAMLMYPEEYWQAISHQHKLRATVYRSCSSCHAGPGPPGGPAAAPPAGGAFGGHHGPANPWSARRVDWSSVFTHQQRQQQHRTPSSTQQQQLHGQSTHPLRQAPRAGRQRCSSGGSSAASGSSRGRGGGGGGGSPSGGMAAMLPLAPVLSPRAGALNAHSRTFNLEPQQHTHIPSDRDNQHSHPHPAPDPRAHHESHHGRHMPPPHHQQLRLSSGGFRYGSAPPPPRLDTTITSGASSRRSSSGSCSDGGAGDGGGRAWGGRGGALSAGLRPGRPLSGTASPLGTAYDSLYPKILMSPGRVPR